MARVSKKHQALAAVLFDLLQLCWREGDWTVKIARRKNTSTYGYTLPEESKVVIFAKAHVGGKVGPMEKTLLHEQIHAALEVGTGSEEEEAMVLDAESLIWEGLNEQRRWILQGLLHNQEEEE